MRKRQIFCLFIFLSIGLLSDAVLLAQKPTSQPLSQTFGDMTQDLDHGKIYRESPDIPRPPQPTGKREDNCYQENFLKPSNGTSVTVATPDTPKPADTQKPVPKTATNHAGAILLTIILLTSCLLGGYIYMDHRYRIWLHSVIEQNNIIVASSAPDISTEISGALTFEPAIVNGQIFTVGRNNRKCSSIAQCNSFYLYIFASI